MTSPLGVRPSSAAMLTGPPPALHIENNHNAQHRMSTTPSIPRVSPLHIPSSTELLIHKELQSLRDKYCPTLKEFGNNFQEFRKSKLSSGNAPADQIQVS